MPGWLGGARAAEATVASDEQVTMSRVRDADEADNIPPRLVVEVEGIVPAWIGQARSRSPCARARLPSALVRRERG